MGHKNIPEGTYLHALRETQTSVEYLKSSRQKLTVFHYILLQMYDFNSVVTSSADIRICLYRQLSQSLCV